MDAYKQKHSFTSKPVDMVRYGTCFRLIKQQRLTAPVVTRIFFSCFHKIKRQQELKAAVSFVFNQSQTVVNVLACDVLPQRYT